MNHTAECDKELFREKHREAGRQKSRRCVSVRETEWEGNSHRKQCWRWNPFESLISSRSFPNHYVDLLLGAKITKYSLEVIYCVCVCVCVCVRLISL